MSTWLLVGVVILNAGNVGSNVVDSYKNKSACEKAKTVSLDKAKKNHSKQSELKGFGAGCIEVKHK